MASGCRLPECIRMNRRIGVSVATRWAVRARSRKIAMRGPNISNLELELSCVNTIREKWPFDYPFRGANERFSRAQLNSRDTPGSSNRYRPQVFLSIESLAQEIRRISSGAFFPSTLHSAKDSRRGVGHPGSVPAHRQCFSARLELL